MFRPVILIPVYNHERHIAELVERMSRWDLTCILVDDGSSAACARELGEVQARHGDRVVLVRHDHNRGKGEAVMTGMARAFKLGFTHALQVDADMQHAVEDVPKFFELARAHPDALVAGQARFDTSVPLVRLYFRYLTHWMVSLNTLTPAIRDAMCGFRVYPVRRTLALDRVKPLGRHMDFDIDAFVRFHWAGAEIILQPIDVRYPVDGVSHFRMWSDNWCITSLHVRQLFGMLARMPKSSGRRRPIA